MTMLGSQLIALLATVLTSLLKRFSMSPLTYRLSSSQSASRILSKTEAWISLLTYRLILVETREIRLRRARLAREELTMIAAMTASLEAW